MSKQTNDMTQAQDDLALLELMMADLKKSPREFHPTNYWAAYEDKALNEIRAGGLRDFRRRPDEVFRSFGAVDFVHAIADVRFRHSRVFTTWPMNKVPGIGKLSKRLDGILTRYVHVLDGVDWENYVRLGFHFAEAYARGTHAKPISDFDMSLVGNPNGTIAIGGRNYSRQHIQYYLQYAYVSRHINFDTISVLAELGSGMGRQTEIIAQLHPRLTHVLLDIPPQLYVAEQFLAAAFPSRLVSYRETRNWAAMPELEPGRIYILGNHKMPLLANRPIDLFWNSASFHEMEPDVVQNYLSYINPSAHWVYLAENLAGGVKAKAPGDFGILNVTTLDHYTSGLPNFDLIDREPTLRISGKPLKDTNMMFRRKAGR